MYMLWVSWFHILLAGIFLGGYATADVTSYSKYSEVKPLDRMRIQTNFSIHELI